MDHNKRLDSQKSTDVTSKSTTSQVDGLAYTSGRSAFDNRIS